MRVKKAPDINVGDEVAVQIGGSGSITRGPAAVPRFIAVHREGNTKLRSL